MSATEQKHTTGPRRQTPGPWLSKEIAWQYDGSHALMWCDKSKGGEHWRRLDERCNGRFSAPDARRLAAAPELLEALQAISDIDDSTNHSVDASAALDRIGQIARQALALPTAEQVDDINVAESFTSVTKTAEPVGDREAFEREMRCEEEWGHRSLKKRQNGQYENWQVDLMWAVWQARAAMSAGDAVDAQRYRWLADCNSYPEAVTLISDGSLTADALGKAIDAAMRKDKL